jgi:hypothetical protein
MRPRHVGVCEVASMRAAPAASGRGDGLQHVRACRSEEEEKEAHCRSFVLCPLYRRRMNLDQLDIFSLVAVADNSLIDFF